MGIELILSALEHIEPTGALSVLVVVVLLVVAAHLMWPGGDLGEDDRDDSHLGGQFFGVDPFRRITMLVSSRPGG